MTMPTGHDANWDMNDILIVDDESANLKLLSEILVKEGYRVRPANSPQLAIDSAISHPPKLILLDVRMPEMDGFEVCRHLKQYDRTRDVPVIFVSALQETQDKVRGFKVGGVDYITKPFDEPEVLARVKTHVDLRNLQLSMEEQVSKRTEEVFESEARFRATFDQAAVGIAHVAPDGRFLRFNDKFCDIIGYERSEIKELSFQDITHPDDLDAVEQYLGRLLNDEIKTFSVEKRYLHKTGDQVWCSKTLSLVRDKAGQPEWFVAVIQDITDKKMVEEDLDIFKKTIEASSDSAYWVDSTGSFVYVNDASCKGLGYSLDELLQLKIFDVDPLLTEDMWPRFWDDRRQLDVLHFESIHRRKDGSTFPVDITSVYIEFNGKELVNGFVRDITERKEAEMALRKNEQLARTLLNATTDLTQLLDEDGTILDLNDAMAEALKVKREDLIGTCVFDKFSPRGARERKDMIRQAIAEGVNVRFVDRNTPYVVYDTGIYPVETPEGEKNQVVIFAHDITEKEKMLQVLQERETKFRRLVENVPDVIWTTDVTGKTIYISDKVQEIFGFSPEEVYKLSNVWLERIHPDDIDQVLEKFNRLFQTGEMFDVEYRIRHKDGHWIWLHDRSMSFYKKDGFSYADGLFSDITFRKHAQQELQKNRDYLEHLVSSIPDAVVSVKLPERVIEWASDSYNVLNLNIDEFIGKDSKCLYEKEEEYEAFGKKIGQAIRDKKDSFLTEATSRYENGEMFPVEINATIYREKGEPVSLTALIRDISDRKKALEALRESEARLQEAQNIARLGFWEWDLATNKLTWSDEMYRIFGVDLGTKMTLEKLLALIHPEDREGRDLLMGDLIDGKDIPSFSYRIIRSDGSTRYIYGMGMREVDDHGVPVRLKGTIQDVTELKTVEIAYRESEAKLQEAQHIAGIGQWEIDHTTDVLTWSDEIFRIFDVDKESFGPSYEAFLSVIHPDDRDRVNREFKRSLETRRPYNITHRLLLPDGRIKFVQERCVTFYSLEGKLLRSVGTVQDITDRIEEQKEKRELRHELAHLNRIMSMNELATSLAHEINQPLGAIMNNVAAARTLCSRSAEGEVTEELTEILEDVIKDTNRAGQIVRKIRGVVKKEDPRSEFELLNINATVDEAINLLQNTLNLNQIDLHLDKRPDLLPIKGDRVRLQQVIVNLVTNAIDAMQDSPKKTLTISTSMYLPEMIVVRVSNSGPVVDAEVRSRLFMPFFSTKKSGLGMGLRICKSIVEEHGGRLWLEDSSEDSTTFSFTIKVHQEHAA